MMNDEFNDWWMLLSKVPFINKKKLDQMAFEQGKLAAIKNVSDTWDSNDLISAEQAVDSIKTI